MVYRSSLLRSFLLLVAWGCSPEPNVPASVASDSQGPIGGIGRPSAGVNGPPSPISSGTEACSTLELPGTPLRRLTRFEYQNTVRDLLHIEPAAAVAIPADEADGFDNNAALQVAPDFLVEKYVVLSEAFAAQAVQNLPALTACDPAAVGPETCARQFAQTFGRRAFRRPITADDESMFMAAYAAGATGGSHAEGIEVMIRLALQSPSFLYRLETAPSTLPASALIPLSPFELATRLSYLIWASGPDDALLDAAANNLLSTREQIAAKTREMLASPKAAVSLNNFLAQWAGLRALDTMTKNSTLFPNYSLELREAMAEELPALLDSMLLSGDTTLRHLLTANVAFVRGPGPLADLYGIAAPNSNSGKPQPVSLPESQGRSGLLTQAAFLSVQGHPDQTSPVLRGKFVRANLLCNAPPPPPDNVDISVPELTDGLTARTRAQVHLSAGGGCSGCHVLMDPIGLAFENFDAMGQYRTTENGQAIDATGEIHQASDPILSGPFTGVRELAGRLADSRTVQDCLAVQWFRFASGRREQPGDACSLATMQDAFAGADGDLIELVATLTQTDAFLFRPNETQP